MIGWQKTNETVVSWDIHLPQLIATLWMSSEPSNVLLPSPINSVRLLFDYADLYYLAPRGMRDRWRYERDLCDVRLFAYKVLLAFLWHIFNDSPFHVHCTCGLCLVNVLSLFTDRRQCRIVRVRRTVNTWQELIDCIESQPSPDYEFTEFYLVEYMFFVSFLVCEILTILFYSVGECFFNKYSGVVVW